MRVFGWSADRSGCCWYRLQLPLDELARRGHDTLVSMVMPDEWRETADVIVGQRVCNPGPSKRWQDIARQAVRPLLVFEVDDNLFEVDPSNAAAYSFFSLEEIKANLAANAAVADVVTVSTEPLGEVMRRINPNVVVVPNAVPQSLLDLPAVSSGGRVTVGWAGSETHFMDFADVGGELVRFVKRTPTVEYHAIGGLFPSLRGLPAGRTRVTSWLDGVEDYYRALDFHIGLAPLRPHVFNQAKSDVKFIEYAARGIPVVASNVGPYAASISNGVTGFVFDRPHEMTRLLRDLVNDEAMRAEIGGNAKAYAATRTVEGNAHLWEDVLLSNLTTPERREAS